jgi:hypothetical protein
MCHENISARMAVKTLTILPTSSGMPRDPLRHYDLATVARAQ